MRSPRNWGLVAVLLIPLVAGCRSGGQRARDVHVDLWDMVVEGSFGILDVVLAEEGTSHERGISEKERAARRDEERMDRAVNEFDHPKRYQHRTTIDGAGLHHQW